jgi:hypothetical protein
MEEKIKNKMHELLDFAINLKAKKHDVFFQYSPHTEQVDIFIYVNGWETNKDITKRKTVYLDDKNAVDEMSLAMTELENSAN